MEAERTELTGAYRLSGEESQSVDASPPSGSSEPKYSPTIYDELDITSMTPEEARREWRRMTLDVDGEYSKLPRWVYIERRNALWQKGFVEKMAEEAKAQKAKNQQWLRGELDRIEERDVKEQQRKALETLQREFGGEHAAEVALKKAQGTIKKIASALPDRGEGLINYLDSTGLGNDARLISMTARVGENPELTKRLIDAGKKLGAASLLELLILTYRNLWKEGK